MSHSKAKERAAADAKRQAAQGLFDQFRGVSTGESGKLSFADFVTTAIDQGLTSGGQLKKEFGICHASLQKAKAGQSTDVPTEVREKFLRGFCNEHGATYYPRASVGKLANTR